ncbi:hypothetical protein [Saccharicrinis aurantiacus]|uniref:hypothetical protein n=1 Tax=Saccharicrinis aurantiacus TaxID=1849719 RepID=UPI000838D316|nr:hypothetical protein [Saccharicrinis aurantiacus]
MKKTIYICMLVFAVLMSACTVDPLKEIKEGDWNKERNVISLLVDGQIGTAVINRNGDDADLILYAKFENIEDLSKVEIKDIELSYGASTPNEVGSILNFANTDTTSMLTVVSGSGTELEWNISMKPFVSDLEGDWYIGEIGMYCDMWSSEDWGWEKTVMIADYLPAVSPELDNKISFVVEGADEKGNPFGSYENNAGNDNLYGDFSDESKEWDFNERFRRVPMGKGTWLRDFARNKVVITDDKDKEYELDLELFKETGELALKGALDYLPELVDWDDTDWVYEELAHMSNPMWYKLTKDYEPQTGNSILNLMVKDQLGESSVDEENKQLVVVIPDNGSDISAIEITALEVSYGASADVVVGSTLDFSSENTSSVTVTSEAGEESVWTIKLMVAPDLAGTWSLPSQIIYVEQEWGDKYTKDISVDFVNASKEYDNEVVIVEEGLSDGKPFGKITNNAGADGQYADYDMPDDDTVDMNYKLRHLLPTGESYWELDLNTLTMSIGVSKDEITSTAKLVPTDTGVTLQFEIPYKDNEPTWNYNNYDNYMCWSYQFDINLDK